MSTLLEKALERVVALPQDEQDAITSQILASLADEDARGETLPLGSPAVISGRIEWGMVLSQQEEWLISVVRALPPEEAGKVLNWARQLADLAGGRTIEWSDSWTDEDLAEATSAALQRFEDQEREEV